MCPNEQQYIGAASNILTKVAPQLIVAILPAVERQQLSDLVNACTCLPGDNVPELASMPLIANDVIEVSG